MAGTIAADTLTHSTAGSIATNYVVEGSAKARLMYDHANITIDGSLNISTVTDDSTGRHQPNFTSNLSLGFTTVASSPNTTSNQNDTSVRGKGNSVTAQDTSGYLVLTYTTTTAVDMQLDASITLGDLV